jgi:hypothetical protein
VIFLSKPCLDVDFRGLLLFLFEVESFEGEFWYDSLSLPNTFVIFLTKPSLDVDFRSLLYFLLEVESFREDFFTSPYLLI